MPYLVHEVSATRRWWVWVGLALSILAVILSGSRSALVAIALVVLICAVTERSPAAIYLVALAAALGSLSTRLAERLGEGSALARLQGEGSAKVGLCSGVESQPSDLILLGQSDSRTWFQRPDHHCPQRLPLRSCGPRRVRARCLCAPTLEHVRGLIPPSMADRLGYVGLTYGIAMVFTNTLWDRFAWLLLSLAIASAANRRYCVTEEDRPARRLNLCIQRGIAEHALDDQQQSQTAGGRNHSQARCRPCRP